MKTTARTSNKNQNQTAHFFNPHENKSAFFSYGNLSNEAFFESKENQPITGVASTNSSGKINRGKGVQRVSKAPKQCTCGECSSCKKKKENRQSPTSFQEIPTEVRGMDDRRDDKKPHEVTNHRINDSANTIKCVGGSLQVHLGGHDENSCEADKNCTIEHEEQHIADWENHYGEDVCQGVPDNHLPIGGDGYDEMLENSECSAYTIGKNCRQTALDAGDSGCDDVLRSAIQRDENQIASNC